MGLFQRLKHHFQVLQSFWRSLFRGRNGRLHFADENAKLNDKYGLQREEFASSLVAVYKLDVCGGRGRVGLPDSRLDCNTPISGVPGHIARLTQEWTKTTSTLQSTKRVFFCTVRLIRRSISSNQAYRKQRGQSNLTKSASRGAHSPVRGHPRGSKFVPLNLWGRVSY